MNLPSQKGFRLNWCRLCEVPALPLVIASVEAGKAFLCVFGVPGTNVEWRRDDGCALWQMYAESGPIADVIRAMP